MKGGVQAMYDFRYAKTCSAFNLYHHIRSKQPSLDSLGNIRFDKPYNEAKCNRKPG